MCVNTGQRRGVSNGEDKVKKTKRPAWDSRIGAVGYPRCAHFGTYSDSKSVAKEAVGANDTSVCWTDNGDVRRQLHNGCARGSVI